MCAIYVGSRIVRLCEQSQRSEKSRTLSPSEGEGREEKLCVRVRETDKNSVLRYGCN